MSKYYILDEDHNTVGVDNLHEWGVWFEDADRVVRKTDIDGMRVSTVFLGLDHSFSEGDPLLFETMVFDKDFKLDSAPDDVPDIMLRCSTWEQALVQHQEACAQLRGDNVVVLKFGG